MIHILPGWVHAVETLEPSIKYAFEVANPADLPLYIKYGALFGTRFAAALQLAGDFAAPQRYMQQVLEAHL